MLRLISVRAQKFGHRDDPGAARGGFKKFREMNEPVVRFRLGSAQIRSVSDGRQWPGGGDESFESRVLTKLEPNGLQRWLLATEIDGLIKEGPVLGSLGVRTTQRLTRTMEGTGLDRPMAFLRICRGWLY